uniref:Uncharacterized protein n=1 Tax=Alexandrium catenella TaxID=2925 RepID=A0A7S1W2K7_ALECA
MGIATAALPSCIVGAAYALQLLGELGKQRLELALRVLAGALAWSAIGLWLFLGLCWQWEAGMCRRLEAERDVACQPGTGARLGPLFGSLTSVACSIETRAECEMLILALYAYTVLALASFTGTLVCIVGLNRSRQEIETKWALQRQGKLPPAAATSPWADRDGDPEERRGLLL